MNLPSGSEKKRSSSKEKFLLNRIATPALALLQLFCSLCLITVNVVLFCPGASWPQWKPVDTPALTLFTHFGFSNGVTPA